ncbi:MAG: homoserine kinase, partial [Myxococcota bacterium]|nr:homoserine kinase [Myxococcota bacterium]
ALGAGALGAGLSGSGPTVFALAPALSVAQGVAEAMGNAFGAAGLEAETFVSAVCPQGARLETDG